MARQRNDEDELTRCVTLAAKVVDKALPLDLALPNHSDLFDRSELRKLAFTAVLQELLDFES